MSNRIKLKRNSASDFDQSTPLPSGLHYGEIGFQNHLKRLFIGKLASNTTDGNATTTHLPLLSDLTYGEGLAGTIASGVTDNSSTIALDIGGISTAITSGLHNTQDHLAISDNGTVKKVTFGNLKDAVYAGVTGGDVHIAAGGAATIQANSVEGSMLNSNTAGTGLTYAGNNLDVAAQQTSITGIYNADLRLGSAHDDHYIDFETDNEIRLSSNSVVFLKIKDDTQDQVIIGDGGADVDFIVDGSTSHNSGAAVFSVTAGTGAVAIPGTLTAGTLSTTNLAGTNVLADNFKHSGGNLAFTIGAGGGMNIQQALNLTANTQIKTGLGGRLRLYTSEATVVAGDVLGAIDFGAPDEGDTQDARALAASIEAIAAAEFTTSSNATKLLFKVGNSETAATAMTIDNNKKVTIEGDLQVKGTTTQVDSTVVTIEDPIFTLGGAGNAISDDGKDRGIEFKWHTGISAQHRTGFFGMDEDDNTFQFIPNATVSSETYSGTLGNAKFGSVAATAITGATINGGTF